MCEVVGLESHFIFFSIQSGSVVNIKPGQKAPITIGERLDVAVLPRMIRRLDWTGDEIERSSVQRYWQGKIDSNHSPVLWMMMYLIFQM